MNAGKNGEGNKMRMSEFQALILSLIATIIRGLLPFERALALRHCEDLAEFGHEVLAEALARLSRKKETDEYWLDNRGKLYWVVMYSKFQVLRRGRRRERQPRQISFDTGSLAAVAASVVPPPSASLHHEVWETVRQEMDNAGLTPTEKNVLHMKYVQGMTHEEIARVTNVTRQTVTETHSRAIIKLSESDALRRLMDDM